MVFRTLPLCCLLIATGASPCPAQVIQLPTFQFFTVSTTVSVPDGGAAYLGGVRRAQYGSTSRGVPGLGKVPGVGRLFSNRGSGSSLSSSDAWVTATIIDHAEWDARLLAEAAGRRPAGTALTETDRKALVLSSHIGRAEPTSLRLGDAPPRESVAAIRSRNAAAAAAHLAEMQDYWRRGQEAESLERWGAARVSYDVIARRGSGELRDRAIARLAELRVPVSNNASHGSTSNTTESANRAPRAPARTTGDLVPGPSRRAP